MRTARETAKGHGRLEERTVETRTDLSRIPDWRGLRQIVKVTRHRTRLNKATLEVVFYITSLPRGAASAETLLRLIRGHWAIENRLHYVRDVTFGEDRSRIRKGHGPENMALLRNLAIGLFRKSALGRRKGVYLPTVIHAHQADPHLALALVRPGIPRPGSDGDLPVNTS